MDDQRPPILVAGAGPTGLVLACNLRRHGVPVRIIDRGEGPVGESRALGIHARTLEIFDQMGVIDPFMQRGERVRRMRLFRGGKLLHHAPVDGIDSPYPFVLTLEQNETESILIDFLDDLDTRVEWNTELETVGRDGGDVRCVVVDDDGRREEVFPKLLVGCDGANSAVRSQLNIPFEGAPIPMWFGLADMHLRDAPFGGDPAIFLAKQGLMGFIPLPGEGNYRLVCTLPEQSMEEKPDLNEQLVREIIDRRTGLELDVGQPWWISSFRTGRRAVPSMVHGPVFLAGDAAHIHSPVGGQGMNTGIQDAHNLAWKLALYHRGAVSKAVVDSYDDERLPVARGVLYGTQALTRLIAGPNPAVRAVRDGFLRVALGNGAVRRRLFALGSQTTFQYDDSPVVGDSVHVGYSRRGPRPGQRAPDVRFGPGRHRRLHELLRPPRHSLLWFAVSREMLPVDYAHLPGAPYLVDDDRELLDLHIFCRDGGLDFDWPSSISMHHDSGGEAHRLYNAEADTLYLIRPDGHIGWRSRPADAGRLEEVLGMIDNHDKPSFSRPRAHSPDRPEERRTRK